MEKEITLQFTNYKLLQDREFNLSGHNVYLVAGMNDSGKTSLITALQEIFGIVSLTDNPVTTGAHEGSKTFQIPDKNGDMVTVKHTYDRSKAKGKFVLFDKDGTPFRKVGEMREILGSYSRITTEQFFDMAKTAEGRRRIISEYFIQFLTDTELGQLNKLQDLEGVNYDLRTAVGKELETAEKRVEDYKLTPADEQLLGQKVSSQKLLTNLKESRDGIKLFDKNMQVLTEREGNLQNQLNDLEDDKLDALEGAKERVDENKKELEEIKRRMAFLEEALKTDEAILSKPEEIYKDELDGLRKQIKENDDEIGKEKKKVRDPDMSLEALDARIKKGEEMMDNIVIRESRYKDYEKANGEQKEKQTEWDGLDKKVNKARADIKALYVGSALPEGVQIEDDTFTLQGFEFSETQVSESKAKLVIAEIMCQVDTSPLLVMGNAGVFGQERLNELCALAEKHNKIMFLEKVEDDTEDVRVVGVVQNKEVKSDKPF